MSIKDMLLTNFGKLKKVYTDGYSLVMQYETPFGVTQKSYPVGSPEWLEYLAANKNLKVSMPDAWCTFRKEEYQGRIYWYGYKWHSSRMTHEKVYVGKLEQLSSDQIISKARQLQAKALKSRQQRDEEVKRLRRMRRAAATRRARAKKRKAEEKQVLKEWRQQQRQKEAV
jgi:hypothetical protein